MKRLREGNNEEECGEQLLGVKIRSMNFLITNICDTDYTHMNDFLVTDL